MSEMGPAGDTANGESGAEAGSDAGSSSTSQAGETGPATATYTESAPGTLSGETGPAAQDEQISTARSVGGTDSSSELSSGSENAPSAVEPGELGPPPETDPSTSVDEASGPAEDGFANSGTGSPGGTESASETSNGSGAEASRAEPDEGGPTQPDTDLAGNGPHDMGTDADAGEQFSKDPVESGTDQTQANDRSQAAGDRESPGEPGENDRAEPADTNEADPRAAAGDGPGDTPHEDPADPARVQPGDPVRVQSGDLPADRAEGPEAAVGMGDPAADAEPGEFGPAAATDHPGTPVATWGVSPTEATDTGPAASTDSGETQPAAATDTGPEVGTDPGESGPAEATDAPGAPARDDTPDTAPANADTDGATGTSSSGVDTAAGNGSGTLDKLGDLAAADVPMVDDGQAAPDLPDTSAVVLSAPDATIPDGSTVNGSGGLAPRAEPGLSGPSDLAGAGDTPSATVDATQTVGGDDAQDLRQSDQSNRQAAETTEAKSSDAAMATSDSSQGAEDVPSEHATLPDGRDAIVIGNPKQCADKALGTQGSVPGKENDCGIVSCANVANQFGNSISEKQAVAYASDNGFCTSDGRTNPEWREQILKGFGIDSTQVPVNTLDDIATPIENGRGEIVRVNAGELWSKPALYNNGEFNHAIQVTGVARDADNGQILGFYVNDSGRPNDAGSGQFISAERMEAAAFPRDLDGNRTAGQNYANVTAGTWTKG